MSEWSKEMHLSCIAPLVRLGSNPSADMYNLVFILLLQKQK
jgi:hypothetical protein